MRCFRVRPLRPVDAFIPVGIRTVFDLSWNTVPVIVLRPSRATRGVPTPALFAPRNLVSTLDTGGDHAAGPTQRLALLGDGR
jgi:hypothetical protein